MKSKFTLVCMLFLFISVQAQSTSATDRFLHALEKLQNAYSLQYNVETTYQYRGEDKTMHTEYKQQKLSYDPYTGYSFYKKIDEDIKIYYHFLELGVIEENKNMLSVFDHAKDPTFSRYVSSYSNDLDNLWQVAKIMENNKTSFSNESSENLKGREYNKYRIQNYLLWLDAKTELPYKLESLNRNGSAMQRMYKNIQFNKKMEESTFVYPKDEGHVLVHRDPNPEPLIDSEAVLWNLKDTKGRSVSLDDYIGKPLFIEAWSSDCNYCLASFPIIKEIQRNYGQSINIVTMSMDYDLAKTKRTIQNHQLPFTVLQGDAAFQRDYLVRSFPSYYVLDKDGKIVLHETGAIRGQSETNLYQVLDEVSGR